MALARLDSSPSRTRHRRARPSMLGDARRAQRRDAAASLLAGRQLSGARRLPRQGRGQEPAVAPKAARQETQQQQESRAASSRVQNTSATRAPSAWTTDAARPRPAHAEPGDRATMPSDSGDAEPGNDEDLQREQHDPAATSSSSSQPASCTSQWPQKNSARLAIPSRPARRSRACAARR